MVRQAKPRQRLPLNHLFHGNITGQIPDILPLLLVGKQMQVQTVQHHVQISPADYLRIIPVACQQKYRVNIKYISLRTDSLYPFTCLI